MHGERFQPSELVTAYAQRFFERATVRSWSDLAHDELIVQATWHISCESVRHCANRGDRELVDALADYFGTRHRREVVAEGIRLERGRHLSLRAGRRSGKHKRLSS